MSELTSYNPCDQAHLPDVADFDFRKKKPKKTTKKTGLLKKSLSKKCSDTAFINQLQNI